MKLNKEIIIPASLVLLVSVWIALLYYIHFGESPKNTHVKSTEVFSEIDILPEFEKSGYEPEDESLTPTQTPPSPAPHYNMPEPTTPEEAQVVTTKINSEDLPSQKDLILENAQNNANHIASQICLEQAKNDSDSCLDSCLASSNEGISICRYAADSMDWSTEKFSECLNENYSIYDQCGNSCINTMTEKQNNC